MATDDFYNVEIEGVLNQTLFSKKELIEKFGWEEYLISALMLAVSAGIGIYHWRKGETITYIDMFFCTLGKYLSTYLGIYKIRHYLVHLPMFYFDSNETKEMKQLKKLRSNSTF